jgi:hypothetical protein
MKDTTFITVILSIVLALVLGGLIGYAIAVESVHKEAVASGNARWVPSGPCSNTFVWVAPR